MKQELERGIEVSRRIYRLFTEKKSGYDLEAQKLTEEIRDYLRIPGVERVRLVNRYDIEGITPEVYEQARSLIFSDLAVDLVYEEAGEYWRWSIYPGSMISGRTPLSSRFK